MARLLVSVRSAAEARAAVAGGAAVVDVKEPDRGPLGRADAAVWRDVRAAVPESIPVSVALGELHEWTGDPRRVVATADFDGIAFRKLGLAGAQASWVRDWARLRGAWGEGPAWVAVAYADWELAGAPAVEDVVEETLAIADCAGLLIDTWDKSRPLPEARRWGELITRLHESGRFVALAGGLTESTIVHFAPVQPDLFAVRGAACRDGDRHGGIDPARVARLVGAASGVSADTARRLA